MREFQVRVRQHPEFRRCLDGIQRLYDAMQKFFLPESVQMSNLDILAEMASRV